MQILTLDLFEVLNEIEAIAQGMAQMIDPLGTRHFSQSPCQIRRLNQLSVAKDRGLDEGVVELSDVPRPGVPL